jgi:hypothetical protein
MGPPARLDPWQPRGLSSPVNEAIRRVLAEVRRLAAVRGDAASTDGVAYRIVHGGTPVMTESTNVKLVVFVPETHADAVRAAIGGAGGGRIGHYSFCSFSSKGIGRFKAEAGAHPAVGKVGELEAVPEERIECVCRTDLVKDVMAAIRRVHPYEEIPVDLYPLLDA